MKAIVKNFLLQLLILLPIALLVAAIGCFIAYGEYISDVFLHYALWLGAIFVSVRTALSIAEFIPSIVGSLLKYLITGGCLAMISGLAVYAVIFSDFHFSDVNWKVIFDSFLTDKTYYVISVVCVVVFLLFYFMVVNKSAFRDFFIGKGIKGKGKLAQIEANLENSRWMTDKERDSIFQPCKYSQLHNMNKDGVPIRAKSVGAKEMEVVFHSPCHSLIIGSTGSGKTTAFINPMIQLLGESGAGSSMIITDPKGELFSLHSKFLASRGYDMKVLDLRDAYHSSRWNPLEPLWDAYQSYLNAENEAFERDGDPRMSSLKITGKLAEYGDVWYEFNGKAFPDVDRLIRAIKLFRTQVFDEMYEDMNDLVSVLVPIQNQNDPIWEKGARAITMGVLLAMLEDSADERLGMTKERFNLFNMSKILQNSEDDYAQLRLYFKGRDPLSKAVASAKQVLDAPDKTRSSYMSVLLEKLSLFNDTGICALTSASDFQTSDLAVRPTALFLKIPDEKDTRHSLASIFMTNVYKALVKVASSYEDLSLPRNVYYILDEFGNKIPTTYNT